MKINSIAPQVAAPSFRALYVTTSTKNHGDVVNREVIKPFQETSKLIAASPEADEFTYYRSGDDAVDAYVLMAGAGTRFAKLAQMISPKHTKISFGVPMVDENGKATGEKMHTADFQLAMASVFADDDGIKRINADVARGTMADIMTNALKLRAEGKPQNHVLLMCGDNNFDVDYDDPYELMRFVTDTIDNPDKVMALFGATRKPQEVVKTFGVLDVTTPDKDNVMGLKGFVEKPATVELAQSLATPDGNCIANTGVVLFKKDAMEYIVDKVLESEKLSDDPAKSFIAKNANEPYDFAIACQRVLDEYGSDACDVKAVDTWEDMGEPAALYSTLKEIQDGCFVGALPEERQETIVDSLKKMFDGKSLLLSKAAVDKFGTAQNLTALIDAGVNVNSSEITVKNIEGVNIAGDNLDIVG